MSNIYGCKDQKEYTIYQEREREREREREKERERSPNKQEVVITAFKTKITPCKLREGGGGVFSINLKKRKG